MGERLVKAAISAFVLVLTAGAAERANASGFQLFDQSPTGQGNAFAGAAAVAEDASTIFFNPAGMMNLNGYQSLAGLQIITPSATLHPTNARTNPSSIGGASAPLTGEQSRDLSETAVVPNVYAMAPLSDDIRAGLGINVPYGLVTDYGSNTWVGRYYATRSDVKTINFNPSVAARITDWLSFGAGVNVLHGRAILKNQVDFGSICANAAGTATCGLFGLSPQANDGAASLEANDTTSSWNAGVMIKPLEHTRIGLTYRSNYALHLDGTASFAVPANYRALQAAVPAFAGNFVTTGAHAKLTLPETASAAIYHEFSPQWAVMGDVTWTRWSRFKTLVVTFDNPLQPQSVTPENWHNTYREALGAIYSPNDKSKVRAGIAYDPTPVPTVTRTLRLPDADRFWLSAGYDYEILKNLTLNAAYTHIFPLTNGRVNLNSANMGAVSGTFDPEVNIFAVGVKYTF